MNEKAYTSFFNRPFVILCFLSCLSGIIFNTITPVLPRYALSLGMSATLAGLLASLFSITALVGRPISGVLADRVSKKAMMIVGISLMAVSSLGMGLFATPRMLMAMRILQGLGFCLNGTTTISAAVDCMPRDRIGEGVGYFGVFNIMTSSIGPTLGLKLSARYGYSFVMFAVAAVSTATVAMCCVDKIDISVWHYKTAGSAHRLSNYGES